MNEHKHKIYLKEMILNSVNKTDKQCHFLDINMSITDKNTIITHVYDKRDDFNFSIHNFTNLSGNIHYRGTHRMIISQLIRYCRICMDDDGFIERSNVILRKLCNQFFNENALKKTLSFFYDRYEMILFSQTYLLLMISMHTTKVFDLIIIIITQPRSS